MDNNGQLTFSDDPLLNATNEVLDLIDDGNYRQAVEIVDKLLTINPDYPGLADCYRTVKFWYNREREMKSLPEGKSTADYLMKEWAVFDDYASEYRMAGTSAYQAAMRNIFINASENYKIAFKRDEDTMNNFDLLLNLGDCFLRLGEYRNAVETLEYARSSYTGSARLLAILGEAYYHLKDYPNSLICFREAFLKNPAEVDLAGISARPILDIVEAIRERKREGVDIREWIPVFGFLTDTFYVRKNLDRHQIDNIKKDVYKLENIYQKMDPEHKASSSALPRLMNLYLWLLEYYELQNHDGDTLQEIKKRLLELDENLLGDYLKKKGT